MATKTLLRKGMLFAVIIFIKWSAFGQDSDAPSTHYYSFTVNGVTDVNASAPVINKLNELDFITSNSFNDVNDRFTITTNAPILDFYIKDPLLDIGYHSEALIELKSGSIETESQDN